MFSTIKQKFLSTFLPSRLLLLKGHESRAVLHLTFDDGPNPVVTPELLDLLSLHNVKATFFCIGRKIGSEPELMERIQREGHLLANHSMNHRSFSDLSLKNQAAEINQTDRLISQYNGDSKSLFRAPKGDWSISLLSYLLLTGRTGAHWSYDSEDFRKEPIEAIVDRFKTTPPTNGEIILFHDDHVRCKEVLASLIPAWKEQGFGFESMAKFVRRGKK